MGEIRIVGPGKTLGYPYPVYKKAISIPDWSLSGIGSGIAVITVFFFSYKTEFFSFQNNPKDLETRSVEWNWYYSKIS